MLTAVGSVWPVALLLVFHIRVDGRLVTFCGSLVLNFRCPCQEGPNPLIPKAYNPNLTPSLNFSSPTPLNPTP